MAAKNDDNAVSTEVDASGRLVDRRPLNDLKPTLRFSPSELPSNPVARAAFPKNLIGEEEANVEAFLKDEVAKLKAKVKELEADVAGKVETPAVVDPAAAPAA